MKKNIIMSLVDVCVFFFFFLSDYYTIKNAILFKEGEKEIKKKRRENDRWCERGGTMGEKEK